MLNLQAVDHWNRHYSSTFDGTGSQGDSGNSSLFFQRVVGSIGSRGIEDIPTDNMEPNTDEHEEYVEGSAITEKDHDRGLSAHMQPGAAADGGMEESLAGLVTSQPAPARQRDTQTTSLDAHQYEIIRPL